MGNFSKYLNLLNEEENVKEYKSFKVGDKVKVKEPSEDFATGIITSKDIGIIEKIIPWKFKTSNGELPYSAIVKFNNIRFTFNSDHNFVRNINFINLKKAED